ncbi:MAG: dUTPase [Candidatus Doudnabacteria bacterium RIFCSPHIGHO2_02_FULL_46_11]|uniref:dUTP diphosphatase n=1 Tax=Candidatus Doudnabacteria bacterium RIFCSPHIGHO2_02_FULL_46_11 TaxID=1817832 RepID=A0A1F5P9Z9_9BACT|nr:MAG: dUTPase [Candidatus Doudnabacteria bacterium RIFCSPHIGHO2_02_FULL_46_11]
MLVKIKRIDKTLPLPKYESAGAAALDLYARVRTEIPPKSIGKIPSNLIVLTPPGHVFIVVPRSSTPKRKGLSIPQGLGIIDRDYSGPDDEIAMHFYNFTDEVVVVERGERIAQGFCLPVDRIEWEETEQLDNPTRGGFGSTGY